MQLRELFQKNANIINELGGFSYPYTDVSSLFGHPAFRANTPIGVLDVMFFRVGDLKIEIAFIVNDSYKATVRANKRQFKLLSTVWTIIQKELPKLISPSVEQIMFTSDFDETSRVSLYNRVAPKLSTLLGDNWIYTQYTSEIYGEVLYIWNKKKETTLTELGQFSYPYSDVSSMHGIPTFKTDTPIGVLEVKFLGVGSSSIEVVFTINEEYKASTPVIEYHFKILSTVWTIIREQLPKFITPKVNRVMFSADSGETSRISLYKRIANKFSSLLGNQWAYSFIGNKNADEVYYIWDKRESKMLTELGKFSYPYYDVSNRYGGRPTFQVDTPIGGLEVKFINHDPELEIMFLINGKYTADSNVTEHHFKILSTVWTIIREQLPKFITPAIKRIIFAANANEPSRVSLYKRISGKISSLLGKNWSYTLDDTKDLDDNIYYIWNKKNNDVLTEVGDFSYQVDYSTEQKSKNEIWHRCKANTPLGLLDVVFEQHIYKEDYTDPVEYLTLRFTVNESDKLTRAAIHTNEQFKVLGTVWQIISTYLPKLINQHTAVISFSSANESSRISLYNKIAKKIDRLLGTNWESSSGVDNGRTFFQWYNLLADQD